MPCRREEEEEAGEEAEGEEDDDSFLLLEQSVTLGGSADVDRLIAQIGETLQLDAAQRSPASPPPRALAALAADKARAPARPLLRAAASAEAPAPPGAVRCALGDRGRVRGRAAPYCVAELAAGPGALSPMPPQPGLDGPPGAGKQSVPQPLSGPCRRGWLRSAAASRRLQQRRGLSLKPAPATTTRTGSCSSWCCRETSSRRRCGGFIRDGCSYKQSFPSTLSSGLCRHRCMSPLRPEVLVRPAATLALWRGGRSSELGTTFSSPVANSQG